MPNPARIRIAARAVRTNVERHSGHANPHVRALAETAAFHASRAEDRAPHDPVFASVHLEMAEQAESGLDEALEGWERDGI